MISYGNLSVIEQGKAGELRQKAFFQLEEINRRLDDGPRKLEGVKTQRLKDQLTDAEPLRGDDGKLWDAVDFWSCYIGYVPVPKAYQNALAPTLTPKRAEEICEKWRQRARRLIKTRTFFRGSGSDVSEVFQALVQTAPSEHQKRFSEVLTMDDYSSSELAKLWVEGDEFLPDQWINAWQEQRRSPLEKEVAAG
ncbi:hypothetical protein [Synechococcus sp. CCY9202]|uniref:hypothetical protein n=1 Tax=Synechococcus sp. CCY9202 TaxID=174698 RepID=UPI002B20AA2F|nr:hypothetical protein [Synechococcus sp. CCY9202]MEA5423140.1 hypothetical protein [Synechococcus sp. CCY9202]